MGSKLSIPLFTIPHRPLPLLEQVEAYCVDKAKVFVVLPIRRDAVVQVSD
jgi:hypothetical protein